VLAEEELEACWRYLVRWLPLKIYNSSFWGVYCKKFFFMVIDGVVKGRKLSEHRDGITVS
jgi:hypothetical protein